MGIIWESINYDYTGHIQIGGQFVDKRRSTVKLKKICVVTATRAE